MHGVSLSIGSTDPLDLDYLHKLKRLADACERALGFRPSLLDRRRGANTHDLSAGPAQRSDARARRRARHASCRSSRTAARAGKSQHLCRLPRFDDERVGVPEPPGRGQRIAVCCWTSTTSMSPPSITTSIRSSSSAMLPHERVVQFHLAGHTQLRHAPHRHTRRPSDRPGLGTLSPGPPTHRRRRDAARMGREDSRVRRGPRRGTQGPRLHGGEASSECGMRMRSAELNAENSAFRTPHSALEVGLPHPLSFIVPEVA